MDYVVLRNELINDPLARGYAGMTEVEAAASLNTADRVKTLTHMASALIYENIVVADFQALTADQKQYVRDILGLGESVDVRPGSKARTVMIGVFGAGSATITALAAALNQPISRAQELGLGEVLPGHVQKAQ